MKAFRSIRNKLLGVVLLTTFCALSVAGSIILAYDISTYRASRINDMVTENELLAYSTTPALQFGNEGVANENLSLLQVRPTISAAAIYNSRGNLFATYVREGEESNFPVLPGEEGVSIENSDIVSFSRIIENGEILGTTYIRSDYESIERIVSFVGILAIVTAGSMIVATLISLWLQRIITHPVRSIASIARDVVSRKEYSQRAEKLSEDEVGLLVDAFNDMLDEIQNRTRELESSNRELEQEVSERKRAREEILRLNEELEQKVIERTRQLQVTNQELESFCYSVSHDLRGPLRSISGFSQALIEELPGELTGESKRYFDKIRAATFRMGQLIEDLLNLSRVSRGELVREEVDFSQMAEDIIVDLQTNDAENQPAVSVWDGIIVNADPKLLRIALENLINNAWKFTSKKDNGRVEVGSMLDGTREVYYVRDNGAGFDMKYADKLFGPFQRLHAMNEYPGTGIGLATVQRIVHRHGGRIWFNSSVDNGAVFYFTLKHDVPAENNKSIGKDGRFGDAQTPSRKRNLRSV